MEDRFRFRAWVNENKEYPQKIGYVDNESFCILPTGEISFFDSEYDYAKNIIIEQCTGIKDKNGTLIYEGDIVKDGTIGTVCYGVFNCSCCEGVYGWYFDGGDIREYERCEVIGNIHENPELVEE